MVWWSKLCFWSGAIVLLIQLSTECIFTCLAVQYSTSPKRSFSAFWRVGQFFFSTINIRFFIWNFYLRLVYYYLDCMPILFVGIMDNDIMQRLWKKTLNLKTLNFGILWMFYKIVSLTVLVVNFLKWLLTFLSCSLNCRQGLNNAMGSQRPLFALKYLLLLFPWNFTLFLV